MKTFRIPLALLLITMTVRAQDAAPANPSSAIPVAAQRTPEELEQLLAPIALYPDALIALILPASTVPTDIVLAARHLQDNPGDRSQIEHRAWDESVKSLTNYPEVLKWMDENLRWTRQVGEAFTVQPADVMQAVQRLRAKARAAGTLVDTPQQQIIAESQVIRIVPAQPDIIYVPHYEPEVVFVDRPVYYTSPFITFGVGVPVGSWLAFDCDWRHNSIWVGNRHRRWTGHDWRHPVVPFSHSHNFNRHVHKPDIRQWRPSTHGSRITVTASNRFRSEVVRPSPFGSPDPRPRTIGHSSTLVRSPGFRDSGSTRSTTFRDSGSRFSGSRGDSRHSGSRDRNWSSVNRSQTVDTPPVVPALPRDLSPGFQAANVGPRLGSPNVAPPLPTARSNALPAVRSPSARVQRPSQVTSQVSRPPSDSFRDHGNRSRSFRSTQPTVTAPLPIVPALPMATPQRSTQAIGPRADHSFSRRSATPAVVPALPMHNRAAAPAPMGPVAPQIAPQSAPTVAPQSAPAQQSSGGGTHRGGHRGAGGRRSS